VKRLLKFLRTTLAGGILFLVPVVVLVMILEKALALSHKLVRPLAEHIPVESVIGLRTPVLLAVGLLVLFCFLAGFIARTALAQRMVSWVEGSILSNVPGYQFLKGVGESMLGVESKTGYSVVFARNGDAWQLGFRVDTLKNGLVAVFLPAAPDPRSGTVLYLAPDRVVPLAVPPAQAMKCLKRLGAGSAALLRGVAVGVLDDRAGDQGGKGGR
jgi:uncharacterized membrane protein